MISLIKPRRTPWEFGFAPGDTHLVINGTGGEAKFFSHPGNLLYKCPALCRGQGANWRRSRGDTPPGLYKLGEVWRDHERFEPGQTPPFDETLRAYGWYTFDMIDLEGNEDGSGRAGIAIHGGGSGNGWPGAWEPKQALLPTHGCVRMRNLDLKYKLLPRYEDGTVFVSVYQSLG